MRAQLLRRRWSRLPSLRLGALPGSVATFRTTAPLEKRSRPRPTRLTSPPSQSLAPKNEDLPELGPFKPMFAAQGPEAADPVAVEEHKVEAGVEQLKEEAVESTEPVQEVQKRKKKKNKKKKAKKVQSKTAEVTSLEENSVQPEESVAQEGNAAASKSNEPKEDEPKSESSESLALETNDSKSKGPKNEGPKSEEPKNEGSKNNGQKTKAPKSEGPKSKEPESKGLRSKEFKSKELKSEGTKNEGLKGEGTKSRAPKSDPTQSQGEPRRSEELAALSSVKQKIHERSQKTKSTKQNITHPEVADLAEQVVAEPREPVQPAGGSDKFTIRRVLLGPKESKPHLDAVLEKLESNDEPVQTVDEVAWVPTSDLSESSTLKESSPAEEREAPLKARTKRRRPKRPASERPRPGIRGSAATRGRSFIRPSSYRSLERLQPTLEKDELTEEQKEQIRTEKLEYLGIHKKSVRYQIVRDAERLLQFEFNNKAILWEALQTHRTVYPLREEREALEANKWLALIGDSMIKVVMYLDFYGTRHKRRLAARFASPSNFYLAKVAKELGIHKLVVTELSRPTTEQLGTAVEALVGGAFIDRWDEGYHYDAVPAAVSMMSNLGLRVPRMYVRMCKDRTLSKTDRSRFMEVFTEETYNKVLAMGLAELKPSFVPSTKRREEEAAKELLASTDLDTETKQAVKDNEDDAEKFQFSDQPSMPSPRTDLEQDELAKEEAHGEVRDATTRVEKAKKHKTAPKEVRGSVPSSKMAKKDGTPKDMQSGKVQQPKTKPKTGPQPLPEKPGIVEDNLAMEEPQSDRLADTKSEKELMFERMLRERFPGYALPSDPSAPININMETLGILRDLASKGASSPGAVHNDEFTSRDRAIEFVDDVIRGWRRVKAPFIRTRTFIVRRSKPVLLWTKKKAEGSWRLSKEFVLDMPNKRRRFGEWRRELPGRVRESYKAARSMSQEDVRKWARDQAWSIWRSFDWDRPLGRGLITFKLMAYCGTTWKVNSKHRNAFLEKAFLRRIWLRDIIFADQKAAVGSVTSAGWRFVKQRSKALEAARRAVWKKELMERNRARQAVARMPRAQPLRNVKRKE